MREVSERYATDSRSVSHFYNLYGSQKWLDRRAAFYREWQQRLAAIPFDKLDQQGRIDYLLIANDVNFQVTDATYAEALRVENEPVLPFAKEIVALEEARRSLQPLDARAAAGALAAIEKAIGEAQKCVVAESDKGGDDEQADEPKDGEIRVQPHVAKRCAGQVDSLRKNLADWFGYYGGFQPDFDWWCDVPYHKVDKALKGYASHLRTSVVGLKVDGNGQPKTDQGDVIVGQPLGREQLVTRVKAQMLAYSPEELLKIGERELAWCEVEMKKAAKELGFDDWREAMESVKDIHVEPGGQADLVRKQAESAMTFVEERNLLTVPALCKETWRVEMMDAKRQLTIPYAMYGGNKVSVAFASSEMDHQHKVMSMRGNNIHFNRIVTAHEVIPGHHLQIFYQSRYKPYRRAFSTPFFVEGWALYWETRLWDLGYARDAKDRIGMLFWRMHRCSRIVVTLKYHLGQMTSKEMVDFIVARGHERSAAMSEVRRYVAHGWSALYQCSYMLGGLQLRALHKEVVGAGKMSEQEFHDTLLRQGPIPNALVRAALTGEPLKRDWRSDWRFAD
jgi:uncharacterized protein (DUF885 family)